MDAIYKARQARRSREDTLGLALRPSGRKVSVKAKIVDCPSTPLTSDLNFQPESLRAHNLRNFIVTILTCGQGAWIQLCCKK